MIAFVLRLLSTDSMNTTRFKCDFAVDIFFLEKFETFLECGFG